MIKYQSIPEYPGYRAGSDGSVWSLHNGKWGLGDTWKKLKPGTFGKQGRKIVAIKHRDGKIQSRYVHQLILEAFVGPRPPGNETCHKNGNADDNRIENLYWGTREQNMEDFRKHGRKKGESHPNHILSDSDVRAIRQRAAANETHESIAKDYPVSRRHISRIIQGTIWTHVD